MQANGSLPRKHILSICNRYSGTSAVRHFVIRTAIAGIRSDTIIGTSLRRACGASCIRLYIFELFKRVSRARTFIVTVIDVAKRVTYRFLTYIIHLQKYNPNRNRHEIRGAVLYVTR